VEAGQAPDQQPRPGVRPEKGARDRLIARALAHPSWALGFADEVWWSRTAQPALRAWADADHPPRQVEQTVPTDDPDPRALACYGLLLRAAGADEMLLRFVDGRPVSALTTRFLAWCCDRLEAAGKTALLLVWDNAKWHVSREVRGWVRQHNQAVARDGHGVRVVRCQLPSKSPWLNPIEPKWLHGKRRVAEPARLLTARELADRVCAAFGCPHEPHLTLADDVA
jgi:transposase